MGGSSWFSGLRPQARDGDRRQVGKAPSSADGSIVARRPGHDNSIGVDVRPRIPRARRGRCRAREPGAVPACQERGSCYCFAPSGGCSSAVERHVANVNVGGSNPLTRFPRTAPIAQSGFFYEIRPHPARRWPDGRKQADPTGGRPAKGVRGDPERPDPDQIHVQSRRRRRAARPANASSERTPGAGISSMNRALTPPRISVRSPLSVLSENTPLPDVSRRFPLPSS